MIKRRVLYRGSLAFAFLLLVSVLAAPHASQAGTAPGLDGETRVAGAICRSLSWLKGRQLADGSFGVGNATVGNASATADAVYVLALAGEDVSGERWTAPSGNSALQALAALAPDYVGADAGQAGKVARAVALGGGDPRSFEGMDQIRVIDEAYNGATGRYHPSFAYRHTLAVEGLARSGRSVPELAVQALQNSQVSDGGWFWAFGAAESDVDTTGRVLELLGITMNASDPEAYQKAADYLAAQQLPGGGWNVGDKTNPANANSTALAIRGLSATGVDLEAPAWIRDGKTPLDSLLSFQESSGAFSYIVEPGKEESRIMATLDAVVALLPFAGEQPYCEYLPLLLRP